MSKRGTNFLHRWLANNLPGAVGADLSVSELTLKLFADARTLGIKSTEIEEDNGSVYQAISDAVGHHNSRSAD